MHCKRLFAAFLSGTLILALSGCGEKPEYDKALTDLANVKSFEYAMNFNFHNFKVEDYEERKNIGLSLSGEVAEGGESTMSVSVGTDLMPGLLSGENTKLVNITSTKTDIYIDLVPLANLLKSSEYSALLPDDISSLGYIQIPNSIAVEALTSAAASETSGVTTSDASAPSTASKDVLLNPDALVSKTSSLLTNIYTRNKSLVEFDKDSNAFTVDITPDNYKSFVAVLKDVIKDGTLKDYLEEIAAMSSAADKVDKSLDEALSKVNTWLLDLEAKGLSEGTSFNFTFAIPSKSSVTYATSISIKADDATLAFDYIVTPRSGITIVAPTNVLTVDEFTEKYLGSILPALGLNSGANHGSEDGFDFGTVQTESGVTFEYNTNDSGFKFDECGTVSPKF